MSATADLHRGRKLVVIAAVLLVSAEVVTDVAYWTTLGFQKFPQQAIRLGITLWIARALLLRRSWARPTLLVLIGIMAFGAVPVVLSTLRAGGGAVPILPAVVFGALLLSGLLMLNPSLAAYLRAHPGQLETD